MADWEQLGSGSVVDAGSIYTYVSQIPNGNTARLTLNLRTSLAGSVVNGIQDALHAAGLTSAQVSTGSPILNVDWLVEGNNISGGISQDPLTDIAIIIGAIAVIAILVTGWAVYRSVPSTLRNGVLTLLLVGGGLLLIAVALNKVGIGGKK